MSSVRTHKVLKGETLATIAATYYGSAAKWIDLYQHNERYLANPNQLDPGLMLVVPYPVEGLAALFRTPYPG